MESMESKKRKNHDLRLVNTKRTKTKLPLKFTDLHEDALIEIFVFLDEQDLYNVIKIDNMFLSSCCAAFRRKHKHEYIQLPFKKPDVVPDTDNEEDSVDLDRTVQLLQTFGEYISKLEFTFECEYERDESIYCDLIVNKCSKSLIEMKLFYPPTELKINKCFKELKTLEICYGFVDQSISQFDKWFPMLENLFIDAVNKKMNMARTISSLKCFSLDFSDDPGPDELSSEFHIEELNRFIKYNPQLKEFRLTLDDYNINTKESVVQFCYDNRKDDDTIPEKMTVKFEQQADVFTSGYSKALEQLKIPFDRIEHLEVKTEQFTKQICDYIAKCVNLKSLKVDIYIIGNLFEDEAWVDSTNCKQLTELEISLVVHAHSDHPNIVLKAIQPYFEECKNLTTVRVFYSNIFDRAAPSELSSDALERQIDHKKWLLDHNDLGEQLYFALEKRDW